MPGPGSRSRARLAQGLGWGGAPRSPTRARQARAPGPADGTQRRDVLGTQPLRRAKQGTSLGPVPHARSLTPQPAHWAARVNQRVTRKVRFSTREIEFTVEMFYSPESSRWQSLMYRKA